MSKALHTVLGAYGAIGQSVIHELQARQLPYRKVSKTPKGDRKYFVQADLLNEKEVDKAVMGSDYVYLCIGLPYQTKIWQTQWEIVMENVIEACAKHQAKLIFLDNIYLYKAPLPVPFDEQTTQQPVSEKGKARKNTADLMIDALETKRIEGLIGRAADFYGQAAVNSSFYISFLERMLKGKNPQSLASGHIQHTYANVGDLGRALVTLALCNSCYGQVWHLPVGAPITIQEVLDIFNKVLGKNYKLSVLPGFLRKILSIFIPPLKEAEEMLYQFESPYMMSFDKFKNQFPDFEVTPYEIGIPKMVAYFQKHTGTDIKSNL